MKILKCVAKDSVYIASSKVAPVESRFLCWLAWKSRNKGSLTASEDIRGSSCSVKRDRNMTRKVLNSFCYPGFDISMLYMCVKLINKNA